MILCLYLNVYKIIFIIFVQYLASIECELSIKVYVKGVSFSLLLMSEKQKYSHTERLKFARYQKHKIQQKQANGEMTVKEWEFEKVHSPKKGLDGKWVLEVEWKNSYVEPAEVFGCEEWMAQHTRKYQGKNTAEVQEDLIKKQMENDKEKEEVLNEFKPKQITQKELDELEKLEKELRE